MRPIPNRLVNQGPLISSKSSIKSVLVDGVSGGASVTGIGKYRPQVGGKREHVPAFMSRTAVSEPDMHGQEQVQQTIQRPTGSFVRSGHDSQGALGLWHGQGQLQDQGQALLHSLHRPTSSLDVSATGNLHRSTSSFDSNAGDRGGTWPPETGSSNSSYHSPTRNLILPGSTPQRHVTPQKLQQEHQSLFEEHMKTPTKNNILALAAAQLESPREVTCLYPSLLLYALTIPLIIMLAFGGRPALLVLAFGAIVAYIFDILGSPEGTLMVALVTVLGIWASLAWAARVLLKQSIFNFIILGVMGILLAFVYLVLASLFKSIRTEFESTLHFLETLMFSTLPLLCACLITWFVCVEVPSLDVPTMLSSTYFVYTLVLCRPRPSSGSVQGGAGAVCNVMTPRIALAMYLLPIYLCPCIHAGFNHHALYRAAMTGSVSKLSGLAASGLFPLLLMSQAALSHNYHASLNGINRGGINLVTSMLQMTKLVAISCLLFCLQAHPYFADLKRASGLPEPAASLLFVAVGFLAGVGVWFSSGSRSTIQKPWGSTDEDDDKKYGAKHHSSIVGLAVGGASEGATLSPSYGRKIVVSIISGSVAALLGVGLGMPRLLVALIGLAGIVYSEYAQRWVRGGWFTWLVGQCMVFAVGGVVSLAALSLMAQSLYFLDVDFHWHGVEVQMKHVCWGFMLLVCAAVNLSSLALQAKAGSVATAFLPVSSSNLFAYTRCGAPQQLGLGSIFGLAFAAFLFAVSAFELFAREQDWDFWETTTEDVYPSFLLGLTALLASMLSFYLHSKALLSLPQCFGCLALQAFKLLHIMGVSSAAIAASLGIFLAYTLPFVAHRDVLAEAAKQEQEEEEEEGEEGGHKKERGEGPSKILSDRGMRSSRTKAQQPSAGHLWLYFLICVTATGFARHHLLQSALEALLLRDIAPMQSTAAAVALITTFLAALLHCFYSSAGLVRSLLLAVAGVGVLVCTDALGPKSIAVDPQAPLLVTINFGGDSSSPTAIDSGLYVLLSCALLALGAGGVIPVRKPISRLLFMLGMTYCGGKALAGWCFPMSLSTDSPHYGSMQIPALFGHIQVGLATSAVLYAALPAKVGGQMGSSFAFILQALVPLAFLLYAMLLHEPEHQLGLLWGGVVVNALVTFVVRCGEMARQVDAVRKDDGSNNSTPNLLAEIVAGRASSNSNSGHGGNALHRIPDTGSGAVCIMAAGLSIAWCLVASLLTPHIDADTTVPLSFLLLLCTRRQRQEDSHPLAIATMMAVTFWLGSTAYSVFVKNFGQERRPEGFELSIGIFRDEDVSVWTSNSSYMWVPVVNVLLALLPLPAVVLSYLRRKQDTEDSIFILAILSVVSVIAGMSWSIRYIGLAGLGYASYRCWEIGNMHKSSDRLI